MKTTMCFEDLDAWKRARELLNGVYSLCRDSGVAKDFGLGIKFNGPLFR